MQDVDTGFIPPTSNKSEKLFPIVGQVLTDRHRGLSPTNLEAQIFLHAISDLWISKYVKFLALLAAFPGKDIRII